VIGGRKATGFRKKQPGCLQRKVTRFFLGFSKHLFRHLFQGETMKVNDNCENYIHLSKIQETQEINQSKNLEKIQDVQRNQSPTDWVTLSHTSNNLQLAKTAVDNTPEIRLEMVERLRLEIASGIYKVDPEKIAEKMVDP
jgi:negative regulator of flagellin synthesis FlgM